MHLIPKPVVCGVILLVSGASAVADTVTFESLPAPIQGANDMSPDGRYIVGPAGGSGYRLDTQTNTLLILPAPGYGAVAVSDDGSVVLGTMIDPAINDEVAAIWRQSTNTWTSLGYLPTAGSCPGHSSSYELSADGSVAVGLSWENGCQARAFRWTQASGMVQMQVLGLGGNRASVVSANGSLVCGFGRNAFADRNPAIWNGLTTAGTFVEQAIDNTFIPGEIYGLNEAGTILLGTWNGKASRWTYPALVRSDVGAGSIIPGWKGNAFDIANNGTVVGFDNLGGNRRAWLQPLGSGPLVELRAYIESNGGTVPANYVLEVCQAISNDGRIIIGHGLQGAWLVTITPTNNCPADVAPSGGNGVVDIDDLVAVITHWGACPGACPPYCEGDVNHDCAVNIDDLVAVITTWGFCPGPQGACCIDGACQQLTEAACLAQSGVYAGTGLGCTTTTCVNNDKCPDAIDITANINGAPVAGNNQLATPGLFTGADEELPAGSPSCQYNNHPEGAHSSVWYTFIAPANGSVTVGTCTSNATLFYDSNVAMYAGGCDELMEIGCSEDDCDIVPTGPYYSLLVKNGLTPGETYYICVMNSGDSLYSTPGPFVLTITSPLPPSPPGGK